MAKRENNIYSYILKVISNHKLASFDIPPWDNIHQYHCNNPTLLYFYKNFQSFSSPVKIKTILAATSGNDLRTCALKDSDQSVHLCSLIRILTGTFTFWIGNDAKFVHKDNEDSDQTVQMPRTIWVFVGGMGEGTFSHVVTHTVNISGVPGLTD